MFTNTIAYNKARIELHAQAVRYNLATDEEKENLPVGKLIPQEQITEELWGLLEKEPLTPLYPTPELGLVVTEDNLDWFLNTYTEWLVHEGLASNILRDCEDDYATLARMRAGKYFPYRVIGLERDKTDDAISLRGNPVD
jgi:hypothetical protein